MKLCTINDVLESNTITKAKLRKAIRCNKIPYFKIGRQYLIPVENEYGNEHEIGPQNGPQRLPNSI